MNKHGVIPLHLPLIDEVLSTRSVRTRRPLAGWRVILVQHVLGSTVPLVNALEVAGVKRNNLEIVGKAYSSNSAAVDFLLSQGYRVHIAIRGYSREISYEDILRRELSEVLAATERNMRKDERLLVLDEGGNAIDLLHNRFTELLPQASCVEQTTRGVNLFDEKNLKCPVINVARSWAKSEFEAPIIACGMLRALELELARWRSVFIPKSRDVLVLGYGVIGRHVCHEFAQRDFNVSVLDRDHNKIERALRMGYTATQKLSEIDLDTKGIVAGCTGGGAVSSSIAKHAENRTLLVSMSSSDLEFKPWRFRAAEVVYEHPIASDNPSAIRYSARPWRSLYRIATRRGQLYLANGGFPIDFTGALDPIPASEIQLTRALMLAAALQATESHCLGLLELDRETQYHLAARFEKLKAECGSG